MRLTNYTKIIRFAILGLAFSFVFASCSDEDNNENTPQPESGNKTSGFVVAGQVSSGNVLVKYFDEIPTGTVDLSDGKDFARFWVTSLFDHEMYLQRPDRSAGFSKMVVNSKGEIVEKGIIATVDESSFRIAVRDAETGVFQDRATPNIITVFNPTTLEVTGTIDMSDGKVPGDVDQRYQRFIFRGDDVFAPMRSNVGDLFSGFYLHQASLATNSYVGTTGVDAPFSGGVLTINNFGQGLLDESGDLYVQDGGAVGSGTFARIYKIPAGSNEIDPNYVFEPVKVLNPQNIFYPTVYGFKLIGNGKAIARVNIDTPQEAIELVTGAGGVSGVLGNQDVLDKVLKILFTAETAYWCELDLNAQTVTPLSGAPAMGANSGGSVIFEHNGEIYFPIVTATEQAYYKYTPGKPQATKAFAVIGADVSGVYNLANNN